MAKYLFNLFFLLRHMDYYDYECGSDKHSCEYLFLFIVQHLGAPMGRLKFLENWKMFLLTSLSSYIPQLLMSDLSLVSHLRLVLSHSFILQSFSWLLSESHCGLDLQFSGH